MGVMGVMDVMEVTGVRFTLNPADRPVRPLRGECWRDLAGGPAGLSALVAMSPAEEASHNPPAHAAVCEDHHARLPPKPPLSPAVSGCPCSSGVL